MWNFPNCLGDLDGKHIIIQALPNRAGHCSSATIRHSYNFACHNFIALDIGAYGKSSDDGIFANSNFGKAIEQYSSSVPQDNALPGTCTKALYIILDDEEFPLKRYLMRHVWE
ncbi:hypothetical protein PR048_002587 [Dryococelus australis]|uniref:DDE Tnp4 domain-containing protein n=1 Tax=Dryococelus australis TaxID=614101 RepID=A0ABQ9IKL1_9NEOP|nr:hypothetical protein PR048_002587 [Dryococelus australis]